MPSPATRPNPLVRWLRQDPYRDLFQTLAESHPDPVVAVAGDQGRVLTCNHAFLLLTGYARPELEALTLADLFPHEAGGSVLDHLLDSTEDHLEVELEVPLKDRAGDLTLVDITLHPVSAAAGCFLLTVRPTRERLHQERLRRSQEKHWSLIEEVAAHLFEGTPDSFPAALEAARRLLASDFCALYRLAPDEPTYLLEGQAPNTFPHRQPAQAFYQPQRPHLWTYSQRSEHPLHRAARGAGVTALQVEPLGDQNAWIGVLFAGWFAEESLPEDLPARASALARLFHGALHVGFLKSGLAEIARALSQLRLEYDELLNAVNDGLILLDHDLRVLETNRAAREMFGYRREEMRAMAVEDLLVGPADVRAPLLDALGHGRLAERARLTLHRRDGSPFPARMKAIPLQRDDRARLLLVLSDRSEHQAIETQTQMLSQRALLGELMAIFAHEVRNPINVITMGVQYLSSRIGEDHPFREHLEKIRAESVRLSRLMEEVLAFSRPLQLNIQPTDIGLLVQRLLNRWEPHFHQHAVQHRVNVAPHTPRALVDCRTFEQVLVNLISNAVQAMEEGGTLTVSVAPATTLQGKGVEIQVSDTGPGIPEDIRERIFEPFFSTKKQGTGLGLAISRRIINAHRGTIHCDSFPDAGTVFTVWVPGVSEEAEP